MANLVKTMRVLLAFAFVFLGIILSSFNCESHEMEGRSTAAAIFEAPVFGNITGVRSVELKPFSTIEFIHDWPGPVQSVPLYVALKEDNKSVDEIGFLVSAKSKLLLSPAQKPDGLQAPFYYSGFDEFMNSFSTRLVLSVLGSNQCNVGVYPESWFDRRKILCHSSVWLDELQFDPNTLSVVQIALDATKICTRSNTKDYFLGHRVAACRLMIRLNSTVPFNKTRLYDNDVCPGMASVGPDLPRHACRPPASNDTNTWISYTTKTRTFRTPSDRPPILVHSRNGKALTNRNQISFRIYEESDQWWGGLSVNIVSDFIPFEKGRRFNISYRPRYPPPDPESMPNCGNAAYVSLSQTFMGECRRTGYFEILQAEYNIYTGLVEAFAVDIRGLDCDISDDPISLQVRFQSTLEENAAEQQLAGVNEAYPQEQDLNIFEHEQPAVSASSNFSLPPDIAPGIDTSASRLLGASSTEPLPILLMRRELVHIGYETNIESGFKYYGSRHASARLTLPTNYSIITNATSSFDATAERAATASALEMQNSSWRLSLNLGDFAVDFRDEEAIGPGYTVWNQTHHTIQSGQGDNHHNGTSNAFPSMDCSKDNFFIFPNSCRYDYRWSLQIFEIEYEGNETHKQGKGDDHERVVTRLVADLSLLVYIYEGLRPIEIFAWIRLNAEDFPRGKIPTPDGNETGYSSCALDAALRLVSSVNVSETVPPTMSPTAMLVTSSRPPEIPNILVPTAEPIKIDSFVAPVSKAQKKRIPWLMALSMVLLMLSLQR